MKTSDKILLCSTLSAIGLFAMVDLLHYTKYKKGEILNFSQLNALDNSSHAFAGIHWVVLDGPIRTTLYPGEPDSLTLSFPKDKQDEFLFHRNADTLLIRSKGRNARDAHQNWFGYLDYPALRLWFPPGTRFHVLQGFAILDNETNRRHRSARFLLDSSQLWIGGYDRFKDSVYSIEPWDTIGATGINSQVILNRQAHIGMLDLKLDNRSESTDRWSTIDSGYVQTDTNTFLHITGKNSKKLQFHVVAHP